MAGLLTVVPYSGLGNRMRVVTSVVRAAEQLDCDVRIAWMPMWDCHARFDELFLPIADTRVTIDAGSWRDCPANKRNLLLPAFLRKLSYNKELRYYKPDAACTLRDLTTSYPRLYLSTCYALAPYQPSDVRHCFRPNPSLLQEIETTAAQFTERTIGVHIRRTDNREAIRRSPLSAFRSRIDQLLEQGEADSIFLCTDDERIKDYFRERYGKRLLTRPVCLNRGSLRGIRDAVVDLWCLSRTQRVLGSDFSSFSDTPTEISGNALEIITDETTNPNE